MTQTYDFNDGRGPVPAQQHPNGGGWVADTATVAETAYVGPDARVFGSARVSGSAEVFGKARVFGSARVYGSAVVFGNAVVFNIARVYGNARISGSAVVFNIAQVSGNARVFGSARVSDPCSVAWGRTGGYDWTAYVQEDGSVFLRYGCEAHPLTWWLEQDKSLSVKHGEDESHWRFVQHTINGAKILKAKT